MDLLIAIVVLVVLGLSFGVWLFQSGAGKKALKPGQNNLVDPGQAAQLPGQPGFQIKPGPGFKIVSRTDGQPISPPAVGPNGPVTTNNGFGQVTQNLSAICRLTGNRVGDCTCPRCSDIKKNRKV